MKKEANNLMINTISAIMQTLVYTLMIALLYRYIIDTLGIAILGLWSVILSTTSLAGLSNAGITSGITKFISHNAALKDMQKVRRLIETSLIMTICLSLFMTVVFYVIFYLSLPFFLKNPGLIEKAKLILPYGFASLFISSIAAVYMSCIDGMHRIYIRSIIVIVSTIAYVILSMLLIHPYGILGLAYAQMVQSIILLVLSMARLKILVPELKLFRISWHKDAFREIFHYSVRLQFITILQIITDPIMKLLLSKFGNIQVTAYYDMALKIINGVRTLIVSAAQSLVPEIARLKSLGQRDNLLHTFSKSRELVVLLSIIVFPSLMGLSILISRIWLGEVQLQFVVTTVIVCAGFFANILSVPVYFLNISTGHLKPNSQAAIWSVISNVVLGIAIGLWMNAYGVIVSWVIASVTGTMILKFTFDKEFPESPRLFGQRDLLSLTAMMVLNVFVFIYSYYYAETNTVSTISVCLVIYLVTFYTLFHKDHRLLLLLRKLKKS